MSADPSPAAEPQLAAGPGLVDAWLTELGLDPVDRSVREGVASWDLILDGRRRRDLRVTLILDPALGLIAWAHYAPPLSDGLRRAYRRLLRWNDEFPFAKFGLTEDERPTLSIELPAAVLSADEVGLAVARLIGIADRLFEETTGWLWLGGRVPAGYADRPVRNAAFLDRYADRLAELVTA